MFRHYYNEQLRNLRELAKEFSGAYPSLAPMLAGQSPDPDVERLLEGVAFLNGMLHEKLDDEFPEIIHGLTDLVFPHFLRPLPSVTLMAFTPKPSLKKAFTVKAGAQIASKEVKGTSCLFSTVSDLDVHPLELTGAEYIQGDGHTGSIKLSLQLQRMPLDSWNPSCLRFHLAGAFSESADLLMLLLLYTESIEITPEEEGGTCRLGPESLHPGGFDRQEQLLPFPERTFLGYRILQEYFLFPQKFMFLDLKMQDNWKNKGKGNGFTIAFRLGKFPFAPPKVRKESFLLHVVPAVNLFKMDAEPVSVDQKHEEYGLYPASENRRNYEIHSIDQVVGIRPGSVAQREYAPFEYFHDQTTASPVYEVRRRPSKIGRDLDVSIALLYPGRVERYDRETLSIALTCSNDALPEHLGPGDISIPTSTSPELLTFHNILTPAPSVQPPLGSNKLWQFLSHLSLNFLSIASLENTRELLNLYIFPEERDKSRVASNIRKVEGLAGLEKQASQRLVEGYMMRGTDIRLKMRQDHFSSIGDMFLFGSVLDYFFGVYSGMNTYTMLAVEETITGNVYSWKPRIGDRFLF